MSKLKRTELYRDDTGKIFTFHDVRVKYAEYHECEEEPSNEDVKEFIFENLVQNGGNIEALTDENNEVIKWCNDYAELMEVDRHLSQGEQDEGIKEIYYAIEELDPYGLMPVMSNLVESDNGIELIKRLKQLLLN